MIRETEPLPAALVATFPSFLQGELDRGHIRPTQGVGFAILSQGFLSASVWGRGNVLFTHTYTVEANPPHLSPEPLERTGVACTWEAQIMWHEYKLWHSYLQSPLAESDKRNYLAWFLEGRLL